MEQPKILVLEEVAAILRREASTVRKDLSANPDRVPPHFKLPGSKTPVWLESKVYEWIANLAGADIVQPKRRGRPRVN
jgi:predicted DNA-binding transcriptional regulator AlpA